MTWQPQALPSDHPAVHSGNVGVLVVNLGTPEAPTPKAVKTYLKEFLSDRRVVEIPPIAWQPILRGIILNTRPKKSAHAYQQVWTEDGSPLAFITKAQAFKGCRRIWRMTNSAKPNVKLHYGAKKNWLNPR